MEHIMTKRRDRVETAVAKNESSCKNVRTHRGEKYAAGPHKDVIRRPKRDIQ